jgi:hypothetical protein
MCLTLAEACNPRTRPKPAKSNASDKLYTMSDEGKLPEENEPEEIEDFKAEAERIMGQAKRPGELPDVPELQDEPIHASALDEMVVGDRAHPELPEVPEWEYERPKSPIDKSAPPAAYSRGMGLAIAIGMSFLVPVLAGVLIGYFIDGRVGGTAGIIGLVLGAALALALLVRLVNRLNADE